jgi:small-conductance mechanosensitive channel
MEEQKRKASKVYLVINIILITLFVALEILSLTLLRNPLETKLLARVISRGVFGIAILYNSAYLLLTKKYSPLLKASEQKKNQRVIIGILLGIVGFGMVLTAFLGYGTNGDPRLIWWE